MPPPVCHDAGGVPGEGCTCNPSTFQAVDCYTGSPGTNGVGLCKIGKRSCDPSTSSLTACIGEVTPQPEVCNLLDDDCNGIIDDVPAIADAATLATCTSPACEPDHVDASIECYGAGVGICAAGVVTCGGGGKTQCTPFITMGAPEVCNGIDDDCNGLIDDGLTDLGACDADASGICATSQYACDDGGLACPASAPSVETCNGLDDDCNGAVDDHACAGQLSSLYCCQSTSNAYACTSTPNDGLHHNCHAAL